MIRAGARQAAAVVLVLAAACRGRAPEVPAGMTVVREEVPPPPVLVEEAQRRLHRRGSYVGAVDGEMSPATRVALARLQREQGLAVTGRLDEPTLDVLGLRGPRLDTVRPPPEPTPAPPLRPPVETERPEPPPGALAEAREEARRILVDGVRAAALLPSAGALTTGPLAPEAARMGAAAQALASSRARAFDRLVEARDQGGWALLPAPLLERLEEVLAARSLLVHGRDGHLGSDDEAAIRWVERSVGLPATGRPNLRLLEILGIDPSPMFEP